MRQREEIQEMLWREYIGNHDFYGMNMLDARMLYANIAAVTLFMFSLIVFDSLESAG